MLHRALIPLAVFSAIITLLTVSAQSSDEAVRLVGADFSAWRPDAGAWFTAADATLAPDDEKLLAAKPGAGLIVNGPDGKTVNLVTAEQYGDVEVHVEFMMAKGSNSGVYFQGRYEIQILDSFGVEKPTYTDCGGIYQRWDEKRNPKGYEGYGPRVNASRAPGEWQTFDIIFRAPKFDADGKKIANAKFEKVVHNGKVIHENQEVTGPTRASLDEDETPLGPIMLQGDHGPVAYRNITVRRLK